MLINIDEHGTQVGRRMLPLLLENDDPHIYLLGAAAESSHPSDAGRQGARHTPGRRNADADS
jgi:hypothetical protein